MKTFKELKKGDKIYYWDKGKLHEQIVHEIEIKDEVSTYKDWGGRITEKHREVVNIVAGKNGRTKLTLCWNKDQSIINYCMKRFSCIEAANKWLESQKKHYNWKIQRLEKRVAHMKNLCNKYNNPEIIKAYDNSIN